MTATEPNRAEELVIRRTLRDGDAAAITELHRRVYGSEYGLNERFVESVRNGVHAAVVIGWPQRPGDAVWLVERDGEVLGALALTAEGGGLGKVRWFVLDPSVRGRGLGRQLIAELLEAARASGLRSLALETFSRLTTAARIYRAAGFSVVSERPLDDWGPPINFQRYELNL